MESKEIDIPVSKPKPGPRGKTGDWKVFKPVLDREKCITCQRCFMYCPVSAIETEGADSIPTIDYDWCVGCGICANECPVDAIEMIRVKGGGE